MSNDRGLNNNDLTTGDRLFDSGVSTDGSPAPGAPAAEKPAADEVTAEPIERNYSTYQGDAVAEASERSEPRER